VGLVLLARTVKDAFAEGCSEFDFLRGDESYKMQWKRAERWTVRFQLFRDGRGRALRAALRAQKGVREMLKAAVPAEALSLMRVARRLLRAPQPEGESRVQALLRLAGAARDGWGKDDAGAASGRG
jgi:CelD/BcsL family acetyltransferase involved in cellulose biosynthesis